MLDLREVFTLDLLLQAYLLLKVLDFITGFLKAYKVEGFKSRKIRDGVIMFIGELVTMPFVGILDLVLGLNGILTFSIKCMFIYKEGVSISENLTAIGIELPPIVVNNLEDFLDKNKQGTTKKGK